MSALSKLAGFGRYLLMGLLLFLLLFSAFLWYITTDSFQQLVRGRLVAAIESASGGRAELGSFHVVPLRFLVEVRNLTIHGREPSSELPLLHVDTMSAVVKVSSILGAQIGFHSVTLDHPVVHIIFYPDGSTNRPVPKQHGGTDFARLFAISVARLEVRQGELLMQDRRLPLEFISNDVSARLNYSFLHRRYSGDMVIGKAETQFDGYRPVAWTGQTAFAVDSSGLQIQSVIVNAGGSKLQARGSVTGYRDPVFKGSYDLMLNLQQAGAIARQTEITSGILDLQGTGSWSLESFAASGEFNLQDAGWQERAFSSKGLSAAGKYAIDPRKINLAQVQGKFARGNFSSDAEIDDWQVQGKRLGKQPVEQRGTVRLKGNDLSLAELLTGLGPRFRAVKELRLAGDLSGNSEIRWRGSVRDAEISSTTAVTPPRKILPGQVPLSASGRLNYNVRTTILELGDFSAATPTTQIRASGPLNSSAALHFSVASTQIGEWRPLLDALVPQGLPIVVRGRAAFIGVLSGTIPNVTLGGNLQLQDFDTLLRGPAAEEPVHWDSLNADLQVSGHNLKVQDAVARSRDMVMKGGGDAGLANWNVTDGSSFQLHLEVLNADAAEAASQLQADWALQGRVNLQLDLAGTIGRPQGRGSMSWQQGSIQGYPFDSATAAFSLEGRQAVFSNVDVGRGQSRISGHGTYDLSSKSFNLSITGTNFDISKLEPLQRSRIGVAGTLDFSADVSGTRAIPDVDAHLRLRDLRFNGELAGDYLIDATTHGTNLRLTGHSEFKTAQLRIDGGVLVRDRWPARIDFHFTHLNADPVVQSYLHGHITGHSEVGGDITVQGPLLDLQQLTATGTLTQLSAEVEKIKLRNQGPVQFSISEQTAKISDMRIVGENTDFSASGSVQLSGERKLDLQGHGQIGLQLVQSYDPDLSGSGIVTAEAHLVGAVYSPKIRGRVQIENGSLADINLPSALSAINGSVLFSQNQVSIETLTAQTGGGNVSFSGHAELSNKQLNFDLNAEAHAVRLRYPPGVSSTATANLHWAGSTRGSLLSGDVTVMKIGVTPGFDFGAYLEKAVQQSSLPQTDPVLNKIRLDMHVVTTPELQMQTNVLRVRGDADMHVRGNAAKPVLLGRAEIFEGEAYFNGTKYRLERGGVTFGAPAANNSAGTVPYVDFEATTRVQDYDITLSINGPADRPKLTYRSEPPLPTNDIIGLLAFGGTTEQSAQLQQSSQSAFSQQASNAMLAAALNATLNNRTQRLFGNSRIKIDPQGLETETSPTQNGPAVTIEQQVKDNLTLTYTTNVSQTSQQIIRAEYNLTRNVSIVAIRDQTGVISFDVKIRRRKR